MSSCSKYILLLYFQTTPLQAICPEASTNLELVEADLLKPETWHAAVAGIQEVYHVASPITLEVPRHDNDIIKPAVDGTLNVLEACRASGTVRKVVITGSTVAIWNRSPKEPGKLTTDDWADPKIGGAYDRSKLLAEQAAWDFMKKLPKSARFELCVLNPGFIMGPLLIKSNCSSGTIMTNLLQRNIPALAKMTLFTVDVRDLAEMHINAMKQEGTSGKRHICVTHQLWYSDMAKLMVKIYGPMGYNVPTAVLPNFLVRFFACFDKTTKIALPYIGLDLRFDQSACRKILVSDPIEFEKTLKDMCHSLIDMGIAKKTDKYIPQ